MRHLRNFKNNMESGVYESGNEQKRAYKRERKLVVIEKNSVDVGFELGGIFNMMSTIREKSFAILI